MKKTLIATAALLMAAPLTASPPPAEGWTRIDEGEAKDYWLRDKDWTSGRPDDTSVLVWSWVDHKRDAAIFYEMNLIDINCRSEAYRFVQIQTFDKRGKSTSLGGTNWEYAAPETIIGEIVRVTCMEPEEEAQPLPQREFW